MRLLTHCVLLSVLLLSGLHGEAQARLWRVGPSRTYTVPSAVMGLVQNGDTVEIDAGLYSGDVGTWRADSLVIRCPNGMAHLDAAGKIASRKGIWVIDGKHTYVEGFEFTGAAISYADGGNGAGIRLEGLGFECRRCSFHDNQEGILTGNDTTNEVLIEACSFDHNGVETGAPAGFEHNIYVGHSRSLTVRFSSFRRSIIGHDLKTRANRNYLLYNFISDDTDGDGSYCIDMPNGGRSYLIGNVIQKGPRTENSTVIDYGAEGIINPDSGLFLINNTVVADRTPTTFLNVQPGGRAVLINNIFAGATHLLNGVATDTQANVISASTSALHFADPSHYDYHPTMALPIFEGAVEPGLVDGFSLAPSFEYRSLCDSIVRKGPTRIIGALRGVYATAGVAHDALQQEHSLAILPDPIHDRARITLPAGYGGSRRVTLVVTSITGAELRRESTLFDPSGTLEFMRGGLPAGPCFFRIFDEEAQGGRVLCTGSAILAP